MWTILNLDAVVQLIPAINLTYHWWLSNLSIITERISKLLGHVLTMKDFRIACQATQLELRGYNRKWKNWITVIRRDLENMDWWTVRHFLGRSWRTGDRQSRMASTCARCSHQDAEWIYRNQV